ESPNTDQALLTRLRQNATPEQSVRAEIILSDKAENDIWVSTTANPVLDENGIVQNIIVILHDITEARQIQSLQNDVMSAMANGMPLPEIADLICRRVETIAPEVTASFLLVEDNLLRTLAGPSLPSSYHDAITGLAVGEEVGSCGTAAWRGEAVLVTDIDADPLWAPYKALALPHGLLSCWSSPIIRQDGSIAGTFAFYFKEKRGPSLFHERIVNACLHLCLIAIEQQANRQEIASLSHFDPLTGALNRTEFYRRLNEEVEVSTGRDLAVLVIGLDHFKDINDSFGHTAGDRVLVEVTDRLNELLQDRGFIGRIGGDLLALLMPKSSIRQASIIATQIFAAIRKPILLSDLNLTTDASIGISLFPDNGKDGETLIKEAEIAMYRVKQSGRGNSEFFSQEMNKIVHERMALASALRNAIANDCLLLHYQPQVRPESGELYGVEALARWSDPVFGDVPPEKFISLAEEIGEIDAIGEWTLRAACSQMAKWRADKTKVPIVSVNLSPLNFRDRKLPNSIAALLKEYELPASCLTIEITEGVMLDTSPQTFEILKNIRRLGVGISMDDFGTGYSSLSNLVSLPITEMKVDRIFIQNFETDDEIKVLVKAIIQLAKALGLTVIVEGIETEAQREMLTGLECDVIQGFLFGRPMPADEIANYVAK
ncbi:EAL domain-containing protein, partial [Paraburkholderia aspalathi]|nr:EAL domain-containing protein [Paraburkholderia aspalathi]